MIEMKFSQFTHAKCLNCGKFGLIDSFELTTEVLGKAENENGTISMDRLIIKCPVCSDEFCEGVFQDEIN